MLWIHPIHCTCLAIPLSRWDTRTRSCTYTDTHIYMIYIYIIANCSHTYIYQLNINWTGFLSKQPLYQYTSLSWQQPPETPNPPITHHPLGIHLSGEHPEANNLGFGDGAELTTQCCGISCLRLGVFGRSNWEGLQLGIYGLKSQRGNQPDLYPTVGFL